MSHERRAIHSIRKAGHPFVGLDVTQRKTYRRAPAFLGLCSSDRPEEPVTGWGVVVVSGGRLSYLQHGLLRPGSRGAPRADVLADLLAAYRPVAVASVGGKLVLTHEHGAAGALVLRYGVADLRMALAPRAGRRSLQEAAARLLALGAIPEPPAASTALAAAVVAAFDRPAGAAIGKETNVLTVPPKETARRPPLPAFPF
jgi:Holliday junction resolvasome RuvABC endonuclease subunit